jgi:F1F0 ATPase subunit 2
MMRESLGLLIPLTLGVLLGMAYFPALEWNVGFYCANRIPLALSIHMIRFLGVAVAFFALARTGAASLLCASVGFQFMRIIAVRGRWPCSEATS